ncbi:unnamed protein product [Bursaphelenchus okinawaensis]|uniref:Uncharacterized protein n=1 Tax=Bursaphelenchus okinawaensis TaxID=465554 RepID=A0A811KSU8_9BILA|nr:unnamed protein product [Bursaphelenchus okinawaensis]CAG9110856.1 unnamed protein product [Bursaphelenchus okinawaensis]
MEDEKKGKEIQEFLSLGPKQYALKSKDLNTGNVDFDLKLRGITLNLITCKEINYESFKNLVNDVISTGTRSQLDSRFDEIRAKRNRGLFSTAHRTKKYAGVFDKGFISDDGRFVLPYGFEK